MNEEQALEQKIKAKGLTAPRITPMDLENAIDPAVLPQFHRFPGTTVTVCVLTLRNGYCVTGESAAVSMENFDEDIGREVAYKDARDKIWPLLGYAMREELQSGSFPRHFMAPGQSEARHGYRVSARQADEIHQHLIRTTGMVGEGDLINVLSALIDLRYVRVISDPVRSD